MSVLLNNPEAPYVLAAYGVAGFMLLALGVASWCVARKVRKKWQTLQGRHP